MRNLIWMPCEGRLLRRPGPVQIPIFRKTKVHAPCPACGLHNFVNEDRCRHCNREFNDAEKFEILEYAEQQKAKGTRLGIFVVGMLILFMLLSLLVRD